MFMSIELMDSWKRLGFIQLPDLFYCGITQSFSLIFMFDGCAQCRISPPAA